MIAIITVENVLARGEDLRTAQPTKIAKALYDGLRTQMNTIGMTRASEEIAKWWLKREHLDGWSSMLSYPDTTAFTWDQWRIDQIRGFLADGWEVFSYIDTNAYVCDEVRAMGVTSMCVSYPIQQVGWKEPAAPREWASVVGTDPWSAE